MENEKTQIKLNDIRKQTNKHAHTDRIRDRDRGGGTQCRKVLIKKTIVFLLQSFEFLLLHLKMQTHDFDA